MSHKVKDKRILEEIEAKRKHFQLFPKADEKLNWAEIYGDNNPVKLEIGTGRGEFLVGQSLLDWKSNYLGIEMNYDRIDYTLRQLEPGRHENVRLLTKFVDEKIIEMIPAGTVRKIYIIHPDPWPKRRHHPRRLIQHSFLDVLWELLDEKGTLEIQTDHAEYGKWIIRHLNERDDFEPINGGSTHIPGKGHIVTYFESKKLREGNKPVYINYRKTARQTGGDNGSTEIKHDLQE